MAPPNPDDDTPRSTNEMWAALSNREKNLVGRSLVSTHSFDIENFFPSAVRLIYDSNQSRGTVQPVELDTQETKAPHATPDTTQHDSITAKNTKLQVEPSCTRGTPGTALSRSDDGIAGGTTLSSDLAIFAATTSRTANDPGTPTFGNGEAGSHKSMTTAALFSDTKPHTSVQSSASNVTDTVNVFGPIFASKTLPAPKDVPCSMSKNSGVLNTSAPPKPLAEGDSVKYTFGCNTNPASTSLTHPTKVSQKKSGSLFGSTPISSSSTFGGTAPNSLFGSNPTKEVHPAATTSSLSTGLLGISSSTAQTNPAGPTSTKAFGSGTTSGVLSLSESKDSPFGDGTSSTATGFGSGLSGPANPAASGFFGTTRPSAGGSFFSQDSAAPSTSQDPPESTSQGGFKLIERNNKQVGGGTSSKATGFDGGVSGTVMPAGSGFFGTTSSSASGNLFGQGLPAASISHASPESASQGGFSFSQPHSGEEGADRSTNPVQPGSLFGNSSSNVASSNHHTSLGSSNVVPTTRFRAHNNPFATNSQPSDSGPNVSVFGPQKRKKNDVEGCEETAKKVRTTVSPLPHNGGSIFGNVPMFSDGFGVGWITSEAKQDRMSAQVSAPVGQASTEALSSTDTTCQQFTGPSSSSTHDSIPMKSPIATTSQTQANTTPVLWFSEEAAGRIKPFSDNDPFIPTSSAKTLAGNVQASTEENCTSTEAVSPTSLRFGGVTTETKGAIATTTEDPFRNIRPTILFDTVEPTVGLPADPKDIPPDSTQDHFVPYRERETNGEWNAFQSNHFMGGFKKFSVEEARLADYNRGQRFGSFPNLLEMVPYEAPKEEPDQKPLFDQSTMQLPPTFSSGSARVSAEPTEQSAAPVGPNPFAAPPVPAGPSITDSGSHPSVGSQSSQQPPAPASNPVWRRCIDCGLLFNTQNNSSDTRNCVRHSCKFLIDTRMMVLVASP